MNKKTVYSFMVVAMLLAVSMYFIGGTYARYASSYEGTASLEVAKWAVKMTNGEAPVTESFQLKLTPEANSNVVTGKIAPGVTASGEIEIDLNGTEVAVDINAKITDEGQAQIENLFGGAEAKVTVTLTGNGVDGEELSGAAKTIALPSGAAFGTENGKYTLKVSVEWVNDDKNNTTDTAKGVAAGTVTVPIELSVVQHIE